MVDPASEVVLPEFDDVAHQYQQYALFRPSDTIGVLRRCEARGRRVCGITPYRGEDNGVGDYYLEHEPDDYWAGESQAAWLAKTIQFLRSLENVDVWFEVFVFPRQRGDNLYVVKTRPTPSSPSPAPGPSTSRTPAANPPR